MARVRGSCSWVGLAFALLVWSAPVVALERPTEEEPAVAEPIPSSDTNTSHEYESRLSKQSQAEADRKSVGCISCHTDSDARTMHTARTVVLGCVDCHGGDSAIQLSQGAAVGSAEYDQAKGAAHVAPRFPERWPSAANPQRSYALLNQERPEFVRFVNPGDLRAAPQTCGVKGCHPDEVARAGSSMMTHGAMLWGAALYNNGAFPLKSYRFGESYSPNGEPQRLQSSEGKGALPFLSPLPRFEISQPGNILRVFERGGRRPLEVGNPTTDEPPGAPERRLSARGYGTLNRTDPVFLNLQKTRLLDPMSSFLGTNDHPGDYRSSGCTACHVVYANDRDPTHSAAYAQFGHAGHSATSDPTIAKNESGHPIRHVLTRSIPTSQCIVCHVHPGTTVTNTYLGYTWWDNETDGKLMYPPEPPALSSREESQRLQANPEAANLRGRWGDPDFLDDVAALNPQLQRTQFGDFNGHGWVFRKVFKKDRHGTLLDAGGNAVAADDPDRFRKAVHLQDIHLEKGMHCIDCHFDGDVHGNGALYGETRAAVEITCIDCHGTIRERAALTTSGPAAQSGGRDLSALKTPFGQRRFQWRGDSLIQRSMVSEGVEWEVVQVRDTIDPTSAWAAAHPQQSERSRVAKTMRRDGVTWGAPVADAELAHADRQIACFTCHSSWMASCFGCHLPMRANQRREMLHNEGETTRNWTSYDFQTIRDDVYMLGIDGAATGHRVAPVRSACAVLVGSQNQNREWVYSQQQTVSAEGFSGHAFSPHVPHTVRATETKTCTDCHVSAAGDNNAIMAQLLLQGSNFVNFLGRYVYVAQGKEGLDAVVVSERDEPQAVIGSDLHRLAYPAHYRDHEARGRVLAEAYEHPGNDVLNLLGWQGRDEVLSLQLRGEYLYTANGTGGLRVYDVANIDNKGFSERIVTAPVSPLGQRLYVRTKYATAVAAPATVAVDPARARNPDNQEQPIHPLYAYLYVADREEGLILVNAATLLDGNPDNNFLERAVTFNPDNALRGAVNVTIAGTYAYVLCDRGVVVVSIDDPLQPRIVATVGAPAIMKPRALAVQFRYAFVTDAEGMKVLDVTHPESPRVVDGAVVPLADARGIYVGRTYAYVAAGHDGLVIIDVERPEHPVIATRYDGGGAINDARDVKIGMTNVSLFAYVADGRNGLRVLQLTSPETTPGNYGFSPLPSPRLIANYPTRGPALALSKGTDRDRAVDESGNQIAVFNRLGARPFNREEMQRMYLRNGELYTVTDTPPGPPTRESTSSRTDVEARHGLLRPESE